ncbi:MAG: hypothetical protein KJ626_09865 [Verrucomicrobia bacterium]|nr:hypothetical protein [Verrucomicrobiota bacterium]
MTYGLKLWAQTALLLTILVTPALGIAAKLPKVMLLIEEKNLGTIPTAEVEALAYRAFLDEGVELVDQEMVRANLKKSQTSMKMAGDSRGAAALGMQFGADIVVVGEAVAKPSARRIAESNLRTYEAVVTLRAVHTESSKALASASEVTSIIALEDISGSSKALKSAGKKAVDRLIPELMAGWEEVVAGGVSGDLTHMTLTFGGVDQLWKLKATRTMLRTMRDELSNVSQMSYTAGAAIFEVDSSVAAEELSEQLLLNAPKGLKYQVLDVGKTKISLRAVAGKKQAVR